MKAPAIKVPAPANPAPPKKTPAEVKPKKKIRISPWIRPLVFLSCAALVIYQSTKSFILYASTPLSMTLSEREVTLMDFPYIILCHKELFLGHKDEQSENLAAVFTEISDTEDQMKNYPWGSVPLQDFKQDQFSDIVFDLNEDEQHATQVKPEEVANGNPLYSKVAGACIRFHPWSTETEDRFLTIFPNVDELFVKFVHDPEDLHKIIYTVKESREFHYRNILAFPHFQLEIKQTERVSTYENPCSEEDGYIQAKCLDRCVADEVLESLTVKCGLPWLKPVLDAPSCSNYMDYRNLQIALNYSGHNKNLVNSCKGKCPEACKQTKYKVTDGNPKPNVAGWPFGFIAIDATVNVVKEFVAYTFMNMFGDIGGIAGIILGYSVFGIYESLSQYIRDLKRRLTVLRKPNLC